MRAIDAIDSAGDVVKSDGSYHMTTPLDYPLHKFTGARLSLSSRNQQPVAFGRIVATISSFSSGVIESPFGHAPGLNKSTVIYHEIHPHNPSITLLVSTQVVEYLCL